MVKISVTLDDLDIIVKSLDSADIYFNSTPENEKKFYDHMSELRIRLEKQLNKWDRVKRIDEKIRWNNLMVRLGRGFSTFDEFLETQSKLRDERRKVIEEVS